MTSIDVRYRRSDQKVQTNILIPTDWSSMVSSTFAWIDYKRTEWKRIFCQLLRACAEHTRRWLNRKRGFSLLANQLSLPRHITVKRWVENTTFGFITVNGKSCGRRVTAWKMKFVVSSDKKREFLPRANFTVCDGHFLSGFHVSMSMNLKSCSSERKKNFS